MISFVSHGDKTLQRLIGMPGEQEHHISSVPFFFFITYKILTCERTLISAPSQPIKAPQNPRHYVHENLFGKISRIKLIVFSMFFHQLLMVTALNNASLL